MSKLRKKVLGGLLMLIGILGAVSFFYINYTEDQAVASRASATYHGPNPITKLFSASDDKAAGSSDLGASVLVATQTNTKIVNKLPGENIKVQPGIMSAEYGIAAGGDLVYFNQVELDEYFKSLNALGLRWVRWDIDWGLVQKEGPTTYQWEKTDRVAEAAKKYNIDSVVIITYAPDWAVEPTCSSDSHCEPIDPKKFGRFAGEVAYRYRDKVAYWEIWNEPNYTFFWGPKPDPKKYAEVLKEAYLEIKKVNPSAVVLSGGLASSGNEIDGSISPLTFVKSLYEFGANKYFDAIAIHPYTYPVLPGYKAKWNRWQEIEPIRKLMIDKGDASKRIWITEFGAPTGGPGSPYYRNQLNDFKYGSDYMYEKSQRDLLVEATNYYRLSADWMGPFFWFSLKDKGNNMSDTENFFGLLRYNGSQKPAYAEYKSMIASSTVLEKKTTLK